VKQVLQNLRSGASVVDEVPTPIAGRGRALVAVAASVVSAGTERSVVQFSGKSLLGKALARPDLLSKVVAKAKVDGIADTLRGVSARLNQPLALGYACSGVVVEVGRGLRGFSVGDRVACAGGGYASHAGLVNMPQNLLAKVPDGVSLQDAAFATLGAIPLHAARLARVQIGEVALVLGLGVLGQLAVQILRAAGCRVVGFDPKMSRCDLASRLGAEAVTSRADDVVSLARAASHGRGVDAVFVMAQTADSEPLEIAGDACRDRGTVIATGVTGTEIPRALYYEKELFFAISRSYGPGRYDNDYEANGHDYPPGYVRWTEQRNLEALLRMMDVGSVSLAPLITHTFPIHRAPEAYDTVAGRTGDEVLGVLLTYPDQQTERTIAADAPGRPTALTRRADRSLRIGVVGAGMFATAVALPALKRTAGVRLVTIATRSGAAAMHAAKRFGFERASTDPQSLLNDQAIDAVGLLTPHNLHASGVIAALTAGKHVFVEKPLCLTASELAQIRHVYGKGDRALMVGFNRRYAPLAIALQERVARVREPLTLLYRVNAGPLPSDHWLRDPATGGGRLVGEGCHFIDFLCWLSGVRAIRVQTTPVVQGGVAGEDNCVVNIEFANGSRGVLLYAATGNKRMGKEYIEVFGGGVSARLEDFRRLEMFDETGVTRKRLRFSSDKGHQKVWARFVAACAGEAIDSTGMLHSSEVTLAAQRSLEIGASVSLSEESIPAL
jgi:predicted dehydrogenase/threonine dehydrogenase-like Zn-dependent dehydrogenase